MFLKEFLTKIDDTVEKDATLQEVVDKMYTNKLHHIVIIDEQKPIGIISERDVVQFFSSQVDFESLAITHAIKDIITLHSSRLVEYALSVMINHNIRKMIVINTHDKYEGCVEQEELIYALEDKLQKKEIKLHELTNLSNKAIVIDENTTLQYALDIMSINKLTSLLVSSNSEAIGIISESDIIKLARENIDQNEIVKKFMHAPIIKLEDYKTSEDMIRLMHEKRIRRVVVYNSNDMQYYTLSSQDLATSIKGSYTNFLQSKVYDIRDTFNALSEFIIELVDIEDEQIIFWTNAITKDTFGVHLDDNITKLIPQDKWAIYHKTLINNERLNEVLQINDRYYQIKGHYGKVTDESIIKLFLSDITEITQLTQKLQNELEIKNQLLYNQSKMVQMGEMIGNIAHQWRQPLSVITTISSGVAFQKEFGTLDESELIPRMNTIVDSANYLSETIDTFRNFIKEKKEKKVISVQNTIDKVLKLTQASLKNSNITLKNTINYDEIIELTLVVGELEQVLINIINNAKDIQVSKNNENAWIEIDLLKTKDSIVITIEDNGGGIPKDILPHIFDEYFTTKEETKGTGLGLHMSKRIIEKGCNGKLYAQNTQNGAKFFIELPFS